MTQLGSKAGALQVAQESRTLRQHATAPPCLPPTPTTHPPARPCRGNNLLDLLEHRNETAALVEAIYTAGLSETLEGASTIDPSGDALAANWFLCGGAALALGQQLPADAETTLCLTGCAHCRPAEIDDDATLFAPVDAAFDALLEKLNVNLTDLAASPKLLTGEQL